MASQPPPNKKTRTSSYTRDDLRVFNLLSQPIWVFDIEKKCMWWANQAACDLWNAESLEALLNRNFADDMSEATARRLDDYMVKFRNEERVTEQWTYYPKGKGPTTVNVLLSGIHVIGDKDEEEAEGGGRLVMLNEGNEVKKQDIDTESLRGVEMLRHLPVSVCQFDLNGTIMHSNPEALEVFGNPLNKTRNPQSPNNSDNDSESTEDEKEERESHFHRRFLDQALGKRVFEQVAIHGNDYCIEAQQHTKHGPRWSSVKVRKARDPVTGQPSILYSARDITDVIIAKKEADEANARKSEFLAVMAHEIRTPLHQVIGFIDLLRQTSTLSPEQSGFVNLLHSSAQSLMAVINDLLDYTKLEAGEMELECLPFEARPVLEGSVAAVSSRAGEKGLKLETHVEDVLPEKVMGDPNRLRQILLNLLNNAVKFTHKGGTIQARVSVKSRDEDGVTLRFSVADTGIGIRKDLQQRIFRKYQQADSAIARNYGGTGLGLAICQRLAEMMGGQIGVDSEVGKGSTFWFELPFEENVEDMESQKAPRTRPRKEVDEASQGSASTVGETSEDLMSVAGLRVLVAEDNKVNQKVVGAMLKRLGHQATIVENGLLAVEMLEASGDDCFDCILMDVQMPVLDGLEATKEIRSRGYRCPIIGLTASFQKTELENYHRIGMTDCLGKPVLMESLRSAISKAVSEAAEEASLTTSCTTASSQNHTVAVE